MAHPIIAHFTYRHLPQHLQSVSQLFAGLRKLLEAKGCAVRAARTRQAS